MKKLIEAITEYINEMGSAKLVELNNRYCEIADCPRNIIWENDSEFFDLFESVEHFAKHIYKDYSYYETYVIFDRYGNLESFNRATVDNLVDYPRAMAEYIAENWDKFKYLFTDIELEEEEEEEEEV